MKKLLIVLCLLFSMTTSAQVAPVLYYTFDTTNPYAPYVGTGNISTGGSSIVAGQVGNCASQLSYRGGYTAMSGGSVTATQRITIQMAVKGGYHFLNNRRAQLFTWGRFSAYFGTQSGNVKYNNITVGYATSGATSGQSGVLDLSGVDRSSLTFYEDNAWHVYAFVLSAAEGRFQLYVDGLLTFTSSAALGTITSSTANLVLNTSTGYDQLYGYFDEVAVYNNALTASQIYKNYTDFTAGNHYTTALYSGTIPTLPAQTAAFNIEEYPVGYTLGGLSSAIPYTAFEQIQASPTPRYPASTRLGKNFCWCSMPYVGGQYQPSVTDAPMQSSFIQQELVGNYNYSLIVSSNVSTTNTGDYSDTTKFAGKWVKYAKSDTSIVTAAQTFWPQTGSATVTSKTLAPNYYLQNSSGSFLTRTGAVTTNPASKVLSPAAPLAPIISDGVPVKTRISALKTALGTSTLDVVSENDEVFPLLDSSVLVLDPAVVSDYGGSGYADYSQYYGGREARYSKAYRDTFMGVLSGSPHYSQYKIDGRDGTYTNNQFTNSYVQRRTIGSTWAGRYYSTSDFYPRWPWNWKGWIGAYSGMQPIQEGRYNEITLGDKVFSPFVSPGWDFNEEINMRPGRWLGLLKMLGGWGADFVYTGYFNEASNYNPPNPPPSSPKGYIWQMLMPSYAQAVWARYDTIVLTGTKLSNVPFDQTKSYAGYTLWSGDPRVIVTATQDSLLSSRYLITATVQPSSNMTGSAPYSKVAKFLIGTDTIYVNARQQGSVYELLTSTNRIRQLDSWHEWKHPMRWSNDYQVEAEVSDSTDAQFGTSGVTTGTSKKDFTDVTSYAYGDTCYYWMKVRTAGTYYGWIYAKKASGATANIGINIPQASYTKSVAITTSGYAWYKITTTSATDSLQFSASTGTTYKIRLQIPSNIYVDKMLWTMADTVLTPAAPSGCATSITVTVTGSTPFCSTDSTLLTANATAPNTYLWSNGATTSTIYATSSGTYTATVVDSAGCTGSGSKAVTTINCAVVCTTPLTVAISGTTSFCDSTRITATATNAHGSKTYLWSTGATTQSIYRYTSGVYTCTVVDSLGCNGSSYITLVKLNCDTVCLPPATVTVDAIQSRSFRVGWTSRTNALIYRVRIYDQSAGTYKYYSGNAQFTTIIVQNLRPSHSYTVRVQSYCELGGTPSSWSSAVYVNTKP